MNNQQYIYIIMLNIRANYIYRGSLIVIFFLFNQFGHGGTNILPILKMSHKKYLRSKWIYEGWWHVNGLLSSKINSLSRKKSRPLVTLKISIQHLSGHLRKISSSFRSFQFSIPSLGKWLKRGSSVTRTSGKKLTVLLAITFLRLSHARLRFSSKDLTSPG